MLSLPRGAFAGLIFTAGVTMAAATAPSAQAPARPTGEAVAIEFFATGPDGPVFDLRRDELTLKINGRPREVRSLRYVSLPPRDRTDPLGGAAPLEPAYATNIAEGVGRWVTIVLDHESIQTGAERNVMNAAVRFVNALNPRDQLSFVTAPRGGVEVQFTTEHERVTTALRKFVGRAPREESERDRACRSRLLLQAMRDLFEDIAILDGPKVVTIISSGVLNPRRDAPPLGPPGMCEISLDDFQDMRMAAAQARAYVLVVQPDHLEIESARNAFVDPTLSRFSAADADRAGLESLAGAAAGDFHRIVGPEDPAMANFARATSGYYIATFEPQASERNGLSHRADLALSREGVRVRTRPEVVIPKAAPRKATAAARDMVRDGILYRGLPLRATPYVSAGEGGKVKVMVAVEPVERGVKLVSAVFGLVGSKSLVNSPRPAGDVLVAQWTADSRELGETPVLTAGEAPPGIYRLRVAAIDSEGRQGSIVDHEFAAILTEAGPLTLSGIALGTTRENSFTPKLVFGSDQAAVVFFETYGSVPNPDALTVRVEVAAGPDERALGTAQARIVQASGDRRMIIGALPIAALPPGDYTVRAIVSLDGRPVGRIFRTLRKIAN